MELKPCDYCESADVAVVKEWRGFYVLCQDCCCRGPYSTNAEQAAELWNTRATDAELDRLRAALGRLVEAADALADICNASAADNAINAARAALKQGD